MTDEQRDQIIDEVSTGIAARSGMSFIEALEIIRIQAIMEGMKAANQVRQMTGCQSLAYEEDAFIRLSSEIQKNQKEYANAVNQQRRMERKRGRSAGTP